MSQETGPERLEIGGRAIAYPLALALGAVSYFLLARLGLLFASLHESASPIWPASGFAVALLILGGRRLWPAIALGAFAANTLTGGILPAGLIACGSTLEALLGLAIFTRVSAIGADRLPLARSLAHLLTALTAPLAGAAIGTLSLGIAGQLPAELAGAVAITWWAGDAIGILIVTPALLNFLNVRERREATPARAKERLLRGSLLAIAAAAAAVPTALLPGSYGTFLLMLPILLLAARWFGDRGISLLLIATAGLWLAVTTAGIGPFADTTLNGALLNMQIMLAAVSFIGLILVDIQYQRPSLATAVFVLGCAIAAAVFVAQARTADAVDARHLKNTAMRIQNQMAERIGTYINALQGGAGFYGASDNVTRGEWRQFVRSLNLSERFVGLNGVGVVLPVAKADADAFIATARRDEAPRFTIKPVPGIAPDAAAHDEHFVIFYSEPEARNAAAIGLDLASEPLRREAAIAARELRQPRITGRVTLVQDDQRGAGFLLFLPIFKERYEKNQVGPARSVFSGWIYAPFTARHFFPAALKENPGIVNLHIHDGRTAAPQSLMFDSRASGAEETLPPFETELTTQLQLAGHDFTLEWGRGPHFDGQSRRIPILLCAGITLFSALLAGLVATLASQNDRARALAAEMNRALVASNERFALAATCGQEGIWDLDRVTGRLWVSPRYYEMLGYEPQDPARHRAFWESVILPEEAARSSRQFDEMLAGKRHEVDLVQRYRHRDGRILHIRSRAIPQRAADGTVTRVVGVHIDITPLIRLEQQFKDAISVMADGFGLFDADDRLILCNDGFLDEGTRKVLGDPVGHKFEEIVRAFVEHDMPDARDPAFDREAWIAQRMERHRNPPPEPIEVKWSGERWMRISERRTVDGGYVGIWSDVTEIRRLGQLLKDAVNALPDAFAIFDENDRLAICNDSYIAPAVRARIGSPIGRTFEELYRYYAELEIADPVKREAWLTERLAQHRNPGHEPYEVVTGEQRILRVQERRTSSGCTVGLWSDVTALRTAERRLQDAIDNINEGFVLLDADLRYVLFNKEFLHLYPKMAPHVAIGARFEDALRQGALAGEYPDITAPEEVEAFVAEWAARYRDPTPYRAEAAFADGRWVLIDHRATSDGGCVNVYTDITEIRQRETDLAAAKQRLESQAEILIALTEELREARRAAEAANISKSHFLANMSHELRTPLNAILGFSEIITTGMFGPVSPPQYREYAADIYKSGTHLLALINDILDLSKIEAERMQPSIEALETAPLCTEAIRVVESLAGERNVTLTGSWNDCPVIHGDHRQMRQILLNLLSNAVKFTPGGGTVTLSVTDEGEQGAAISVRDTGIGMTPAEIKRAMERFGQAEPSYSKSTPGTGLGLPLVEGLVKLHGGTMTIDSIKGAGTTVTVRLPWREDLYCPRQRAAG